MNETENVIINICKDLTLTNNNKLQAALNDIRASMNHTLQSFVKSHISELFDNEREKIEMISQVKIENILTDIKKSNLLYIDEKFKSLAEHLPTESTKVTKKDEKIEKVKNDRNENPYYVPPVNSETIEELKEDEGNFLRTLPPRINTKNDPEVVKPLFDQDYIRSIIDENKPKKEEQQIKEVLIENQFDPDVIFKNAEKIMDNHFLDKKWGYDKLLICYNTFANVTYNRRKVSLGPNTRKSLAWLNANPQYFSNYLNWLLYDREIIDEAVKGFELCKLFNIDDKTIRPIRFHFEGKYNSYVMFWF